MDVRRSCLTMTLLLQFICVALATTQAAPPADSKAAAEPAAVAVKPAAAKPPVRTLGIVLYENFEPLDVYGPVEVFGNVGKDLKLHMIAEKAGPVASTAGGTVTVAEFGFDDAPKLDLILVPGGIGTLKQLRNERFHQWLRERAPDAEIVMSVCSGSAILAHAGLLDGLKATTNKQSFRLLTKPSPKVNWVAEARWVDEGKFVTSSGVSAGIDMSLHVVERLFDEKSAQQIADGIEFEWTRDPARDPFAKFAK